MKKTLKNVLTSAVALVMALGLIFGVMPPSQAMAIATTSTTVTLEVLPGDGYISLLERYADILPVEWTEEDLINACGGRVLVPGTLQVSINGSSAGSVTQPNSNATTSTATTVKLEVYPGDGYFAVWARNRQQLPSNWGWQELERACNGKVLVPGTLQVNINGSTRPAPGDILGSRSMTNRSCSAESWHNIMTSAEVLNGKVIPAGCEFNWWEDVGPCTSWPYVEAATTDGTATGGGICFTSTVLYQAAVLKAEMKSVERHDHWPNKKIWYANWHEDAAINFGTKNMKFRNNKGIDIRIETNVDTANRTLTIKIVAC